MSSEMSANLSMAADVPHIVFACDEAYAMPLATVLRSIAESTLGGRPHQCWVLSNSFAESSKRKVASSLPSGCANIHWIPISTDSFEGFYTAPGVSSLTFARLLIPYVLPKWVARVIYLDADVLVRQDLLPLWRTSLRGSVAAAVIDDLDQQIKNGRRRVNGMPQVKEYFNAGVLLIDLEKWRDASISEKALDYLQAHPNTPYMDQDGLNVALDGRWKKLDRRWNFQNHYNTNIDDLESSHRPAIAHFVTSLKPWLATSLNPNQKVYDDVRSRTRYARSPDEVFRDMCVSRWYSVKRSLRRYGAIRSVEARLRPKAAIVLSEDYHSAAAASGLSGLPDQG